jgi:hypothetical protein
MAAIFDEAYWDFPNAGDYLTYAPFVEFDCVSKSFTAIALIEVPAIPVDAYGCGIMGKRDDPPAEDSWALLYGYGAGLNLRGRLSTDAANANVTLADPILPNTKTLVALRYTYFGGGANVLEVVRIDHRGLASATTVNAIDNTAASSSEPFWVAGRAGITNLGGKMYWAALFQNQAVGDADLAAFYNQETHPCDSVKAGNLCRLFLDFHQAVSAVYVADYTRLAGNVPPIYITVNGAPTKGGISTTPSMPPDNTSRFWLCNYTVGPPIVNEGLFIARGGDVGTYSLLPIPTGSFSIVAMLLREGLGSGVRGELCTFGEDVNGWKLFGLELQAGDQHRMKASSTGNAFTENNNPGLASANLHKIFAFTYQYVGAGAMNVANRHVVTKGAATPTVATSTYNTYPGPIFDPGSAPQLTVGRNLGLEPLRQTRIYWLAYYKNYIMSTAELIDLHWRRKHPVEDFNPDLYVDFSKDVAATYVPERGGVTFTVEGTPVIMGTAESSLREDYPPGIRAATFVAYGTIQATFDSPMEDNAAFIDPANYTFIAGGTATPTLVTRVNYNTVTINYSGVLNVGASLQVSTVEDILGTTLGPTDTVAISGIVPPPIPPDVPGVFVYEILLGDSVVWSDTGGYPQKAIELDTTGYTGKKRLKFRIRRTS